MAQPGGVVEVGGVRMEAVAEAVRFRPGASYLLVLNPIPGSSAFGLVFPPVPDHPRWSDDLRNMYLPIELTTHAVSFARLVEDVAAAAAHCPAHRDK
jgi:hypothetical protein